MGLGAILGDRGRAGRGALQDLMPRDFHSREGIDEWLQSLDDRWPARAAVSEHIVAQTEALPAFDPHVVELAPGGLFLNATSSTIPKTPAPAAYP